MASPIEPGDYWMACTTCHDYFQDPHEAKAHEEDCRPDGYPCLYRIETL